MLSQFVAFIDINLLSLLRADRRPTLVLSIIAILLGILFSTLLVDKQFENQIPAANIPHANADQTAWLRDFQKQMSDFQSHLQKLEQKTGSLNDATSSLREDNEKLERMLKNLEDISKQHEEHIKEAANTIRSHGETIGNSGEDTSELKEKMENILASSRNELLSEFNSLKNYLNEKLAEQANQLESQSKSNSNRDSPAVELDTEKLRNELMTEIQTKLQEQFDHQISNIQSNLNKIAEKSSETDKPTKDAESANWSGSFDRDDIVALINARLERHYADKIALVDYALYSAGARVITEHTSPSWKAPSESLLGSATSALWLPSWLEGPPQPPETALNPDITLGECWAFPGTSGLLVVQLARPVRPTAVTIEHAPASVSLNGQTSAPRQFEVFGLAHPDDAQPVLLGKGEYKQGSTHLQTFQLDTPKDTIFPIVALKVLSNQGHKEFTCLYRFRVHGTPSSDYKNETN